MLQLPLCVPKSIRQELEITNLRIIQEAASSFAQLSAPPNSSCWLQAKFLSNILHEYDRFVHPRRQPTSQSQLTDENITLQSFSGSNEPFPKLYNTNAETGNPKTKSTEITHSTCERNDGTLYSFHEDNLRPPLVASNPMDSAKISIDNSIASEDPFIPHVVCWDDEVWEHMFANAGFSIAEGVLLVENNYS